MLPLSHIPVEPLARLRRRPIVRLVAAFAIALAIAFSVYLGMSLPKLGGGAEVSSIWFLMLLPALLSALICYIADASRERSTLFYLMVPIVLAALVCVGAVFLMQEGAICIMMLSPIWVLCGWGGAFALRAARRKSDERERIASTFVVLPVVAALLEGQVPTPHEHVLLTRSVLIHATPAEIWPYAVANPSIGANEGRWNLTQNVIGVPRPRATVMHGVGVGAVRMAYWDRGISFEEDITRWAPGRQLGWNFKFSNRSLMDFTDKHISPDGQFLKIDSGDYTLTPVAPGLTRLTLNTRYIAMTHMNAYAKLWGEFLLGDVQGNILAIIQGRAEAAHARHVAAG